MVAAEAMHAAELRRLSRFQIFKLQQIAFDRASPRTALLQRRPIYPVYGRAQGVLTARRSAYKFTLRGASARGVLIYIYRGAGGVWYEGV